MSHADQQIACMIAAAELFESMIASDVPFDDDMIAHIVHRMYSAGVAEVLDRLFRHNFAPIKDEEYPVDPGD